ncbi:hypothetical protein Cgig2_027204 [Carnegiea gigantea]|uniref:Uncharacterized protein n=1 Tax=Carnegiea gigantea TaxID=171969 RepID=A0A9Q1QNX6_9CARY|nr:hypothetical protein Cgig2_027204 [Carnegiea gigantea]
MAFSCFLGTKAIGEYVTRHFAWDRRGVAFPPLPLLKDFQALCPSFELAVAEEAAEYYELPELPQVIFYAMLLNEAERLGVLQGRALRSLESARIELRWSTFESWVWLYGDRIFEARFCPKVGSGESSGTSRHEEGSEVELKDEDLAIEKAASPLDGGLAMRLLGIYLISSSPNSSSINTTSFSHIGYSSIHFSRGSGTKYRGAISTPVFLVSMAFSPTYNAREMANYVRSPSFGARGALRICFAPFPKAFMPYAHTFRYPTWWPTLSSVTFYAMLLNKAVELGVVHDFMAKSMKSSLVGLRWSTFKVWMGCVNHRSADEVEVRGCLDGQEEGSRSNGPLAPSSDEE